MYCIMYCRAFCDEGPMLETLDYTIRIGSTPTFSYFDLYLKYLYSAYAAHYTSISNLVSSVGVRSVVSWKMFIAMVYLIDVVIIGALKV